DLRPEEGRVLIEGREIGSIKRRELARIVAVVPQRFEPLFPFTVRELVLMGRAPYLGMFGIEGRRDLEIAEWAMEVTDILHLADRGIDELSGGELQRAVIARALAQRPKLMLLDEPTSHLDLKHQIGIMELIAELNAGEGLTVVLVSHDLNLASQYCHRVLALREGEVYAVGRPEEVITEAMIREVYGVEAEVVRSPRTGLPFVIPLSDRKLDSQAEF
ncbi:MAG: cobalamin/Fe3+-siderophore ABC transporter ATP-binding protein, partial [Thaumarchaeota archaeon]